MPRRPRDVSLEVVQANEVRARVANLPAEARALRITTEEKFLEASGMLKTCKNFRDEIEKIFEPICKAAHTAWKTALAQRKTVEAPVEEAEKILRPALAAYAEEKERRRLESEAAEARSSQEQAAALERGEEVPFLPSRPEPELPKPEGLSFRDDWDFEITDAAALPRLYLKADEEKIRRYVKAFGKEAIIPGVRVFSRKVPVQR
jgi:hypothetical protein